MIYAADEGNYVSYVIDTMHSGSVAGDDRPRRTQSAAHPQHGGHGAAAARRVVQLLLAHPLVDRAAESHGWRCGWCHPPDHLKPDQVRWEPAPEETGPCRRSGGQGPQG